MSVIIKLLLSSTAVVSSIITVFMYKFFILGGMHNKLIIKANKNLQQNLTNHGLSEYMHVINSIKKIPDTNGNYNLLVEAYDNVCRSKDISADLKAQFRVLLLLKGIKKI